MADEEDHVQGLESKSLDHEEIGRPDRGGVVGEKRAPALAGRTRGAALAVAADGAGADHDPEFEQVAADARGPESGFSRAMVLISSRTSGFKRGRPRRQPERQRQ